MLKAEERQIHLEKMYIAFNREVLKELKTMTKNKKILLLLQIFSSFEDNKDCCKSGCKQCCDGCVQSGFPRNKHFMEMFIKGIPVPFNHEWFNHNVLIKRTPEYLFSSLQQHLSRSKLSIEILTKLNDEYVDSRHVGCPHCKELYLLARSREQLEQKEIQLEQKEKQEEKEGDDVFPPVADLVNLQDQQQSLEQKIEECFKQRFGDEWMKKILLLLSFTSKQDIMMYLIDKFDNILKISRYGSSVRVSLFEMHFGFHSDIDLASPDPKKDNSRIIELLQDLGFNVRSDKTKSKYGLIDVISITYWHSFYEFVKGTIDIIDIKFLNIHDVAPEQCVSIRFSDDGTLLVYYGDLRVLGERNVSAQMSKLRENILKRIVTLYRWDNLPNLTLRIIWAKFRYIQKLLKDGYDIHGLGFCGMPFVPNMTQEEFKKVFCKTVTNVLEPLYKNTGYCRIVPKELADIMIQFIGPGTFSDGKIQCSHEFEKCEFLFNTPCCNRKICLDRMKILDSSDNPFCKYKCSECLKKP